MLCNLSGSSNLTMDDYDSVCNYLHTRFNSDNYLLGLMVDDWLGENLVVNLVATQKGSGCMVPDWIDIRDRINRTPRMSPALIAFCSDDD